MRRSRMIKIVATLGPATDAPGMLEAILRAGVKLPVATELAQTQFGALQIDEDGDRPPEFGLDRTHGLDQRLQIRVRGVTHVDAEDIGARHR